MNENKLEEPKENIPYVDTAYLDVQLHLTITDPDTDEILVNQRG